MLGIEKITYRAKVVSGMTHTTLEDVAETLKRNGQITFVHPTAMNRRLALKAIGINTIVVNQHTLKYVSTNN